ncbi:MAG: HAD hydrolase family protein [Erysipelotrichaceae bacterium]|nr:HAD hydrolase family protein [Erysipelotrichaceae bacterium]
MGIIFIDVDETLYSHKTHRIPGSALYTLAKLKEKDHIVILSTHRSMSECTSILNLEVRGMIMGAGALIYLDGKRFFEENISMTEIKRMEKMFIEEGCGYCLEGGFGSYCDPIAWEIVKETYDETDDESRFNHMVFDGYYDMSYRPDIDYYTSICLFSKDEAVLKKTEDRLEEPYVATRIHLDNAFMSEVLNSEVTKLEGVRILAAYFGMKREDIIFVGDGVTDIEVMDYVGHAVAMGNAPDEVKKHADIVTDDILCDGLYKAFVQLGVIEDDYNRNA